MALREARDASPDSTSFRQLPLQRRVCYESLRGWNESSAHVVMSHANIHPRVMLIEIHGIDLANFRSEHWLLPLSRCGLPPLPRVDSAQVIFLADAAVAVSAQIPCPETISRPESQQGS